jgi:phospholipid/cholesterol/gamma-HCH transport system substrate-binding protein
MTDKNKTLTWTELRVGVVVVLSLGVLAATVLYVGGGGGSPFAPKYRVKALMSDVNGLKSGAPVRVGGLEVGNVTRVAFGTEGSRGMVEIEMRLDRRVQSRVTTESKANLGSLGLLGEKAVDITSAGSGTSIEDGGYLASATEDPIKGVLSDASDSTQHLKKILSRLDAGEGLIGKALRDDELYVRMVDVSVGLQAVMTKLQSQEGPLGRMMNDRQLADKLSRSLDGLEAVSSRLDRGEGALGALTKDEQLGQDLKSLVVHLSAVANKLDQGQGTAGKLLEDKALYERLDGVTAKLDKLLTRLDEGDGSAARVLRDPELYNNANAALKELHSLVEQIRKDPRKYLRVKLSLF